MNEISKSLIRVSGKVKSLMILSTGSLMAVALKNLKRNIRFRQSKKHRFWVKGFLRFKLLVRASVLKKKVKLRECCGKQEISNGTDNLVEEHSSICNIRNGKNRNKLKVPLLSQVEELFVPLKESELAKVKNALSWRNRMEILVLHKRSNIVIRGETLQCLKAARWLNDEVINLYLELLKERQTRDPEKYFKCHFFNTFFYIKLVSGSGYNYEAVRRWTTLRKLGYDLIDCDLIFVPIHGGVHWSLAVINNMECKFMYLDSLSGRDPTVLSVLAKYLADEIKDKNGKRIDVSSWDTEYVQDIPRQQNGYDCGMFMLKYIDFYSRGLKLQFSQKDMSYFRSRTAKEILLLQAH